MLLIETTDADFAALIDGRKPQGMRQAGGAVERPEVLAMLRDLAAKIRPVFEPASWMMVEDGEIVGLCSVVKTPSDREVFIGYGVTSAKRRKGLASSAVRELLKWARRDDRVWTISAETSVDNLPSQRVLEVNGFQRAGERFDEEDGSLICWSVCTA